MNGSSLINLLFSNVGTGRAVYSICTKVLGEQQIVKEVDVARGWTSMVPMNINGRGVSDLLSYYADCIFDWHPIGLHKAATIRLAAPAYWKFESISLLR